MDNNLLVIERELHKAIQDKENIEKEYKQKIKEQDYLISSLTHKKNIIMNDYNLEKIENAKRFLYTEGCKKNFYGEASSMLMKVIQDVIDGCKTLLNQYMGCKNYASFIGQGIICDYGMCPSHGSVVMRIGTTSKFREKEIIPTENDYSDMLYFLNLLLNEKSRNAVLTDRE